MKLTNKSIPLILKTLNKREQLVELDKKNEHEKERKEEKKYT